MLAQLGVEPFRPSNAPMRIKPYLLPVVLFAFAGPGIGSLVFILPGADVIAQPAGIVLVLVFGYGIGIVPAALAGAIYVSAWNARGALKGLGLHEFGALLGAASGVVALALLSTAVSGTPIPRSPVFYVIPLVAGAVCGWLAAPVRDEAYGWTQIA